MPRTRADGAVPDWPLLQAAAAAQGGYFSLRDAQARGICRQLLQHRIGVGTVRRVGRAAFQLAHFAPSPHEDCIAAWLWGEGQGVFSHATSLWLHGLIDMPPACVHLTLPWSWRRLRVRAPPGVALHCEDLHDPDRGGSPPLTFTELDRALVESAEDGREADLVESAFLRAHEWGLRDASTLRLWLPPYHPLRRHFPVT
jgi:hypothetical protein